MKLATQIFLKKAYPEAAPKPVLEKVEALQNLRQEDELISWSVLEREGNRYSFRLGHPGYPHMKLVFLWESHRPVFYVDAHDSHFNLPEGVPGYDKLMALRRSNKELKQRIEGAWAAASLPIFGQTASAIGIKQVCKGMRVLAVDDEVQILEMLGLIITNLGAEFLSAQSAEEARNLIVERGLPDLIFCDIMMPRESGYDFVSWLKANKHVAPLYFITGYALNQVYKDGYAEVLQKPFSAKSVMGIMKACHRKIHGIED